VADARRHLAAAFTAARLARERGVAGRPPAGSHAATQAGLFDRRAERDRQDHRAALAESEQALADRLQAAAAGGAIALVPPRLLLVLVP
jgi:hypothetical protein